MKLTHQILAVLVLGIWVAALAQADARPRGGKHAGDAAGHAGAHRPAGLAKPLRNATPVAPIRNAIGAVTPPAGVGSGTATHALGVGSPVPVVKPNAINAHIGTGVVSPTGPTGAGKIGSTTNPANAVRAAPSAMPAHTGGINGTGMAHPSNTLGTIGGPAKLATGITGTGMRPKK
jgi:hypothetical protein